jgi:hypothetical protein
MAVGSDASHTRTPDSNDLLLYWRGHLALRADVPPSRGNRARVARGASSIAANSRVEAEVRRAGCCLRGRDWLKEKRTLAARLEGERRSLQNESGGGADGRLSSGSYSVDDLGGIDPLQVGRGSTEVGVSELALDDVRRDPLSRELDGGRVA